MCADCGTELEQEYREATETYNSPHNYDDNGNCSMCQHHNTCEHTYDENGYCEKCQSWCPHKNLDDDDVSYGETELGSEPIALDKQYHARAKKKITYKKCLDCGCLVQVHEEIIENSIIERAEHNWNNGCCSVCGYACQHEYENSVCTNCSYRCPHQFNPSYGRCPDCGYICQHEGKRVRDEDAAQEEYIWIDGDKHLHRTYKPYVCETCGYTGPLGTGAIAEEEEAHTFEGDTCTVCGYSQGSGISYESPNDGTLAINGSGVMPDYDENNPAPWAGYGSNTKRIIIDKNVTRIGKNAFAGFNDPDLRVEFLQGSVPVIEPDAFSGRTNMVVCRYYSDNGTWPGSNGNQKWIHLPYFDVKDQNSSHDLYYNGRWYIMPRGEDGFYSIYVTQEEALEYSHDGRELHFEAVPAADDPIVSDGWDKVSFLSIRHDEAGQLKIALNENSILGYIDMTGSNMEVEITDPRTNDHIRSIHMEQGTLKYTGDIDSLELANRSWGDAAGHMTVNGNVKELKYYPLNSDAAYKGDLSVTGTIASGTIFGNQIVPEIPGIGQNVELVGTNGQSFTDLHQDTSIITNSVLTLTDENQAKLIDNVPDISECSYRYDYINGGVSFSLESREGGSSCGRVDDVYKYLSP